MKNTPSLINISNKYYIDYRMIKTWFYDEMSGYTGYLKFSTVYVNKETNQVCWFEVEPSNNGFHMVIEKEFRLDFSQENEQASEENLKGLVDAFEKSYDLPIVQVNDYLKGGKYYDLALQWFKDNDYSNNFPEEVY